MTLKRARPSRIPGVAALLLVAVLFVPGSAQAQDWSFGMEWGSTFGGGNLKDYIDRVSWRNFGLDIRNYQSERWSVGITGGWHVFDQKLTETAKIENGAITGTQLRYVNAVPIMLSAQYHLGDQFARNRPFVGLGVGASNVLQRLEIGIVALEESNWHLAIAPEVGYAMGTGPLGDTKVVFRAAAYHAFKAGEDIAGEKAEYTYGLISIGFAFR